MNGECPHEHTQASVEVARLTTLPGGPVTGYAADVRIWCIACGEPFLFAGLPAGLNGGTPSVSADGQEARLSLYLLPALLRHRPNPTPTPRRWPW